MYINHYSKAISEVIESYPENAERYLRAMGQIILACTQAQIAGMKQRELDKEIKHILGEANLVEVLGVLLAVEALVDVFECPDCPSWKIFRNDFTYNAYKIKYNKMLGRFTYKCLLCNQTHMLELPTGERQTRRDIDVLDKFELTAENVSDISKEFSDRQLVRAFRKAERDQQNINTIYKTLRREVVRVRKLTDEEQTALSLMD